MSFFKKFTRYHFLILVFSMAFLGLSFYTIWGTNFNLTDTKIYNPNGQNLFGMAPPHNNPYPDADAFLLAQFDGVNPLTLISYDNSTPGFFTRTIYYAYGGTGFAGWNFPIEKGKGYELQIAADTNTVMTGTSDPSYPPPGTMFTFNPLGMNLHYISLRADTTWTTSQDVLAGWYDNFNFITVGRYDNSIPGPVQQSIEAYCSTTSSCWTQFLGPSFDLIPGEAIFLQVTANVQRTHEPYFPPEMPGPSRPRLDRNKKRTSPNR